MHLTQMEIQMNKIFVILICLVLNVTLNAADFFQTKTGLKISIKEISIIDKLDDSNINFIELKNGNIFYGEELKNSKINHGLLMSGIISGGGGR